MIFVVAQAVIFKTVTSTLGVNMMSVYVLTAGVQQFLLVVNLYNVRQERIAILKLIVNGQLWLTVLWENASVRVVTMVVIQIIHLATPRVPQGIAHVPGLVVLEM